MCIYPYTQFIYVSLNVCMYMCVYVHVSTGSQGGQKRVSEPMKFQMFWGLMKYVPRTKLRSFRYSGRSESAVTTEQSLQYLLSCVLRQDDLYQFVANL